MVFFCAFLISFLVAREIFFESIVFGDYALVGLNSGPVIGEYIFNDWHRAAYGGSSPVPFAYLFLYLFGQLASYVGRTEVFSFMMNLSFPLSFIAFYFFSKKFCESMWSRIFGAAFYIINPVVITYYNFGGFMWVLVFLPLSLSFFIDLLEKQTNRKLAKAATFTILTMWAFPNLSVILFFVLFTLALSYLLLARSTLNFLKTILPRLLLFFVIALVCNTAFLFAQYVYSQSPSYGYNAQTVLSDFIYTYEQATIVNLLSFAGNRASPQISLGYLNSENVGNEISVIILIIAFASFYWILKFPQKRNRIIAMLMSVSFTAVFLFLIRCITYSQFDWIITDVPLLWTLRNPVKLQLMLVVCMIPLFIFSMEKIAISCIRFFRKRNLKLATLTFTLVFLGASQVYVYNSFVFNGHVGLDRTYGPPLSYVPDPTITRIINDSLNWYKDGTYRGIILPFDHYTELQVQFANPLLYPSILGLNSEVTNEINDELEATSNLKNLFSLLSTKYVYANRNWTDTEFPIIQTKATNVIEDLKKENLTEEPYSEYSSFVIENALPSVYLSSYPVFCFNVKTIESLNDTVFYSKPVFLNINYDGNVMSMPSTSMIFSSYSWEMPFPGTYALNAAVYGNEQEMPIYYSLDGPTENKIVSTIGEPLKYLATFELKAGSHRLLLATPQTDAFMNLKGNFEPEGEGGSWSVQGNLLEIKNGILPTSQEYDNFDCCLRFKPRQFGIESWNGPEVRFAWVNSSYLSVLYFHEDGRLELKLPSGGKQGAIVRQTNMNRDSWNLLRLIKREETISLYLNGKPLLTFSDPTLNISGRIGIGSAVIGSAVSITDYENATISRNIIDGLALLPAETPKDTPRTLVRMDSGKYVLQFNQTHDSGVTLFLGESYDPLWEATMDGKVLSIHSEANTYGNSWSTNITQGAHEIQIYYKPNEMYRNLLYMNLAIVGILLIAAYFPIVVLNKLRFLRWKTAGKKLIRKT
jgi:hypothetical protein